MDNDDNNNSKFDSAWDPIYDEYKKSKPRFNPESNSEQNQNQFPNENPDDVISKCHSKGNFYFTMSRDGLKHFECIFCGDTPVAGHSTEREYEPNLCWHQELKKLQGQGILCSNCYNWDYDLFKRDDSPRKRDPLKHKSGRLLTMTGWLDQGNDSIDKYFG